MGDSPASEPGEGGPRHLPVLLAETLEALAPGRGGTFVDATVGAGGHAQAILEASDSARLVGIDRDPHALALASERLKPFGDRVRLVQARFSALAEHVDPPVAGILADLGVSSMQLNDADRGFSLKSAGPLDMRMDPTSGRTLADILGEADEEELATWIRELGEERRAHRVARNIIRSLHSERGIDDTAGLARVVRAAVGGRRSGSVDSATRTFQALRIAVNQELEELEALLELGPELLAPAGVLVIISFHSLEDRKVKHSFRERATFDEWELVQRKVVRASNEERTANPRSRSAKLRALRRHG